jgi:hypothetical protein
MSEATRAPVREGPASEPPDSLLRAAQAGGARTLSDAERRGAFLAAAAVLAFFGVVMLGWAVLSHASSRATDAPPVTDRRR